MKPCISKIIIFYIQADEINEAGCRLVTEVARKYDKLIGLPISTTRSYAGNEGKEKVQKEIKQQIEAFEKWDGDLLMAEVDTKYARNNRP